MNGWMDLSDGRTSPATKTALIVVLATGEHAFTARPGDRPNAAAAAIERARDAVVNARS